MSSPEVDPGPSDPADAGVPGASLLAKLVPFLAESMAVVNRDGTIKATFGPPNGLLRQGPRLGSTILEHAHPDDLGRYLELGQAVLDSPPGWEGRLVARLRHAEDGWQQYEVLLVNLLDDPDVGGILLRTRELPASAIDAAVEGPNVEALRFEQLFETLADAVPSPVLLLDPYGRCMYANPAASRHIGLSIPSIRNAVLTDLVNPAERAPIGEAMARLTPSEGAGVAFSMSRADDGAEIMVEGRLEAYGSAGQTSAIVAHLEDVTSRRRAERELLRRATLDPLTQLPNRAAALDALRERLSHSPERVAVAYCDLDGFKEVNDTHGHQAGDEVLILVAAALRSLVRPDDLVARIGGDEFVVITDDPGELGVDEWCARFRDAIATETGAVGAPVGGSVGFTRGRPGDRPADVLARADAAMYAAKRTRRLQVAEREP